MDRTNLVKYPDGEWGVRFRLPTCYRKSEFKRKIGTISEARAFRDTIRLRIRRREELEPTLVRSPQLSVLLEEVSVGWKDRDPRRTYARYWSESAGEMRLDEITRPMVQSAIDALAEKYSGNTVKIAVTALRSAFELAVETDRLDPTRNPFRAGFNLPELAKSHKYLTREQARAVVEAAGPWADLFLFAILAGLRGVEIRRLTWEFVDLHNRFFTLTRTKQKKPHLIPITDALLAILKKRQVLSKGSEFVWTNRQGNPWKSSTFQNMWKPIFEKAGVPDKTFHCLRHTSASFALSSGCSLSTVKSLLGHSSQSQTERYAALVNDPKKEAIEKISVYFSGTGPISSPAQTQEGQGFEQMGKLTTR